MSSFQAARASRYGTHVCRTVKHTWLELGNQLSLLATLHADKAKAYMNEVRQPLLDLAPSLEESRKEVSCCTICGDAV